MKLLSSIGPRSMLIAALIVASASFAGAATRVLIDESFDSAQPGGVFQPDDRDYRLAGKYFTKNLAMHRALHAWREELVKPGVLDPKQYPDKGGGGNPWD